jgi:DNA-3-methyladenine glycosylase II
MEKIQNEQHFKELCDWVIAKDERFEQVSENFGYPPLWFRPPNFDTLILTILEQQVSLAAARSAYNKLVQKVEIITPENLLVLSDEELRDCYFSRQKIRYARILANEISEGHLNLEEMNELPEHEIRSRLIQLKGIGHWTIDMYVLMSLHFADIFPPGDLATIKAVFELKLMPEGTRKNEIVRYMEKFKPYRSAATYLLWHYYLEKRNLEL